MHEGPFHRLLLFTLYSSISLSILKVVGVDSSICSLAVLIICKFTTMLRFVSGLASKARLSHNNAHQVGKRLNMNWVISSRGYAPDSRRFIEANRDRVAAALGALVDGVPVTLGTKGRNVSIELDQRVSAPGDEFESDNTFAAMVAQWSNGGSTSATLLTSAILAQAPKNVTANTNFMDLRRGIAIAADAAITFLKSKARMITTYEEVAQVGTTLADGEKEIGELIAKAMDKVGKDGVVTISDGTTSDIELEIVGCMKLDSGYITHYLVNDEQNQKCELEDPLILMYEKKISRSKDVEQVLEFAVKRQRPLFLVAEDVEGEALAALVTKKFSGVKVCAIKAPGVEDHRKASLQDLAILTGGQVITEEQELSRLDLEKDGLKMLGSCKKITVSKDETLVQDGAGDKKAIEERCEQLRSSIESSTSDDDKEKLQQRLAKLSDKLAVLKIGGANEAEIKKKKERVAGALNATKAAVEEGIVAGDGVALVYASRELEKLQTTNSDMKIGIQIIQNALKSPLCTIASNAGSEGEVVVDKLLEQDNADVGYNPAKGEYVDMFNAGIIDPLKFIRMALENAASPNSVMELTEFE